MAAEAVEGDAAWVSATGEASAAMWEKSGAQRIVETVVFAAIEGQLDLQ